MKTASKTRRNFLKALVIGGCAAALGENLYAQAKSEKTKRPNIIFLLADDQCTYSVGCYGNKDVKTPQMDRLGNDGVIFDNHYNTNAICMASRASIMTGKYEYKTGCNFSHGDMKPGVWKDSYPVLLRKSGHLTAFAGKFGFKVEGKGLCEGDFDEWGGEPGQTHYETAKNKSMAKYNQLIYAIDVSIGMIRDELERQGIADNTVIIYTSDNGYICGSHGYGSKVLPMEESSRVPLMIYDPRRKTSEKKLRCEALTGNIDFAPTIMELAGVSLPDGIDGKSLLPLIENPNKQVHEHMAFINVWGSMPIHSLTALTKDWKYTYWWYGGEGMTPTEELFDTANDPLELENLANDTDYKADLERMRKNYNKELTSWKKHAVAYNNYQKYSALFDRSIAWSKKTKTSDKPGEKKRRKK